MKEYHIEFSHVTREGKTLVATCVQIGKEIIQKDSGKKMNVALCDDPLYPILEQYVLSNPSGKND